MKTRQVWTFIQMFNFNSCINWSFRFFVNWIKHMNLWFPKIWIIIRIIFLNRLYSQPRLFFSTNDVLALKEKAQRSHSEIFARITSAVTEMKRKQHQVIPPSRWEIFSRSWNEIYGNNLPCLAFYCLLNSTDREAFGIAETAIKR